MDNRIPLPGPGVPDEGAAEGRYGTLYWKKNKYDYTMSYDSPDDNIADLRAQYPNGLHFIVGDIHGEVKTLKLLMEKIGFDPTKDHVYFLGDYNGGGNVTALMRYLSNYYSPDSAVPGFHMIRGNHERELGPVYALQNLPDVFVIREKHMDYYLAHAGMIRSVFDLIGEDMEKDPSKKVFSYGLTDESVAFDAPLRQMIWSRHGLYSQRAHWSKWPRNETLTARRACIIHGHSPYSFFMRQQYFSYGEQTLFWKRQHVFFSESLQSFNIDANVKGRYENGETYRGLACVCLEALETVAANTDGKLTCEGILNTQNAVFAVPYAPGWDAEDQGDPNRILSAAPEMKRIGANENGEPYFI